MVAESAPDSPRSFRPSRTRNRLAPSRRWKRTRKTIAAKVQSRRELATRQSLLIRRVAALNPATAVTAATSNQQRARTSSSNSDKRLRTRRTRTPTTSFDRKRLLRPHCLFRRPLSLRTKAARRAAAASSKLDLSGDGRRSGFIDRQNSQSPRQTRDRRRTVVETPLPSGGGSRAKSQRSREPTLPEPPTPKPRRRTPSEHG